MNSWPIYVVLGIGLLELVLSLTWSRFYISKGIPIFFYEVHLNQPGAVPPQAGAMEDLASRSTGASLQFRQLEEDRLAFREQIWHMGPRRYTPLMHGVLTFDTMGARVQVTGLANWYAPAFLIGVLAIDPHLRTPLFLGFFAIIMVVCYFLQASCYREVAKAAAGAWETRPGIVP